MHACSLDLASVPGSHPAFREPGTEASLDQHVTFACNVSPNIFSSRSARSTRTAGTKMALRFPRLFVCLSVCASALITLLCNCSV